MPDPSAFDRAAMLAQLAHPDRGRGGIVKLYSKNKGFSVEIRPSRWQKKIWIGKLETLERAQYVADAVYRYLGMPPFHFDEGVMTLPAITCIGTVTGTPVELSTQEMRANYVRAIAKGLDFEPQREDFILKVKHVVQNPDFPFLSPPRTEVVDDDSDRQDEFEYDEDAEKALQMSSNSDSSGVPVAVVQTHVAGRDSGGGSVAVQAYVPSFGFDSNGSEYNLRSAGQSINAILFNISLDDCPTTSSEDEKIWIESIEELAKFTAAGTSTPACNDGEVCRDGYETSPILNIPRSISSSDRPSSEFSMNAKRQKIGG